MDSIPNPNLDGDTQRLAPDSPLSECEGSGCTIPIGEETEVVGEEWDLDVETQDLEGRFGGETQVLEETQVLGEEFERNGFFSPKLSPSGDSLSQKSNLCSGSQKRCISSVRVSSIRAARLSIADNVDLKSLDTTNPSALMDLNGGRKRVRGSECVNVTSASDAEALPEQAGNESHANYDNVKSGKLRKNCKENGTDYRSANRTARKLFGEEAYDKGNEINDGANISNGEETIGSRECDRDPVVAGLSYVASQEPTELSQAKSLNVIDNLLSMHDVGLTQDASFSKTAKMKLPPISDPTEGSFMSRAYKKNPVEEGGIFDWDDNLEDESGGGFYSKVKYIIFSDRDPTKNSDKVRMKCDSVHREAFENGHHDENVKRKSLSGTKKLYLLSSRIKIHSSGTHGTLQSSTEPRKNLPKEPNEQLNAEPANQFAEEAEPNMHITNDAYGVGPDTQMAAEGIEALLCSTPMQEKLQSNTEVQNGAASLIHSVGVTRKFKRMKVSHSKVSTHSSSHKVKSKNSKPQTMCAEDEVTLTMPIVGKSNPKEKSGLLASTNRNRKSDERSFPVKNKKKSSKIRKSYPPVESRVGTLANETCISNSDVDNTCAENVHRPSTKEHAISASTPVARRTRSSRATKTSKASVSILDNCAADMGAQEESRITQVQDKSVASSSGQSIHEGSQSTSAIQVEELEKTDMNELDMKGDNKLQPESCKTGSEVRATPLRPKRRRTPLDFFCNSNVAQSKVAVKTSSTIEDNVRRKRRAAVGWAGKTIPTGVRTRSSSKSRRHTSETIQNSVQTVGKQTSSEFGPPGVSSVGNNIHEKMVSKELQTCPTEAAPPGAIAMSEVIRQPGSLSSSPLNKIDEGSPICAGSIPQKTPHRECLTRPSLVKALAKLEFTGDASNPILSDTRRRKDMSSVRVLFSRHLDSDIVKKQKKILSRLGLPIAASIGDATHFIADNFVRTRNMLEAIVMGKPVVTHMWLESCAQARCYIDEKKYIMRDLKKEKEVGFVMPVSLAHACERPLLQNKRVYITPNVKPDRSTVSSLVKAAGGLPLERFGRTITKEEKLPDNLLVLSSEEDFGACTPLLEKGAEIYDSELLLNGIVIQRLEYQRYRLFVNQVKKTRSTIWLRNGSHSSFVPVTKCK